MRLPAAPVEQVCIVLIQFGDIGSRVGGGDGLELACGNVSLTCEQGCGTSTDDTELLSCCKIARRPVSLRPPPRQSVDAAQSTVELALAR